MTKYLFILLFAQILSQKTYAKNLILRIGMSTSLSLQNQEEIKISNGSPITWQDFGDKIQVTGRAPGYTVISTSSKKYFVSVLASHQYELYKIFSQQIKNMKGLKLSLSGIQLQVTGRLYRLKDWKLLNKFAEKYQQAYLLKTLIAPSLQEEMVQALKPEMLRFSHLSPEVKFTPFPTAQRLSTLPTKSFDHLFSMKGFSFEASDPNQLTQQIELELNFVELGQGSQSQLGVLWNGQFAAQLIQRFKNNSQIDAFLNQTSNSGETQLISKNTLICEVNFECNFSDGGEFPIKSSGYKNSKIIWKKFGLNFKFQPRILPEGKIKLKLDYEISQPDPSLAIEGVPGLRKKKLTTSINTINKTPFLVTGLNMNRSGKDSDGLIPLKHLPLIGRLLSNTNSRSQKSKMVLIVKPKILN